MKILALITFVALASCGVDGEPETVPGTLIENIR